VEGGFLNTQAISATRGASSEGAQPKPDSHFAPILTVCEECRGAQALADLCQQPGRENEGQKRIRRFGKVEIPQSAFFAALKMGDG
jgi:hypothetical protein